MKIKDVLGISNARLIIGNEQDELTQFSKDTRTIKKMILTLLLLVKILMEISFLKMLFQKELKLVLSLPLVVMKI